MITVNIPTDEGKGVPLILQPIDAGDKFTGIATFGISKDSSPTSSASGQAGLLNVEMSSNINNAGETRLLVKVTAPYFMTKSQSCGCDGTSVPSFAKSGTIGAHVVLTLPKGFTKDYVQSDTTFVARRQLNAVIGMLLNVMSGTGGAYQGDPFMMAYSKDGQLIGGTSDSLGLYETAGIVNRAVMGLRPAAPDKTYGSEASA